MAKNKRGLTPFVQQGPEALLRETVVCPLLSYWDTSGPDHDYGNRGLSPIVLTLLFILA